MKAKEISYKIAETHSKIDYLYYMLKPIPNELILEHNKLLNDYNEALKKEKDGDNTRNIN